LFLSASEWELLASDTLRVADRCKEDGMNDVHVEMTPANGTHVMEDWVGFGVPESMDLLQKESRFIIRHVNK